MKPREDERSAILPPERAAGGAGGLPVPVAPPPIPAPLPASLPVPARPRPRSWQRVLPLLLLLAAAAAGGGYWWLHRQPALPPGIAMGNGRLEADEIDIATKFAGRVARLLVDEGDRVTPGQVVAVMDTRDLEATMKRDEALVAQAQRSLEEARANQAQAQAQLTFAQQQLDRASTLVRKGYATVEALDQATRERNVATALVSAAAQRASAAQSALEAATHEVELYRVNIADNSLVAPKVGRIEYRVANVGEVLPAGGKVFTMLDASYVYMDVYLPTAEAGRVQVGGEARIVLDAYPGHVIPATVVFVARQAQFTPKTVETRDERDKLMFRIRARIDPARLAGREDMVRSGLPGVTYLRVDPAASWPAGLQPSPLPAASP
ncbi:MAG: HlyD family efflux transporter periplasmic adaptor subunit [Dongiaceae bacterium]